MPLFPVGDNDPIDIYPIIPSLDGTELLPIANKGTTLLYASTGQISDFVSSVNSFFDIRDYGAVGNGTTDDTAAIQSAVTAAGASAFVKHVYFPNPTSAYVFSAPVKIPDGVTVYGDNVWDQELSRCKPKAGYSGTFFTNTSLNVTRALRVGIIGLFLDGSATTLTAIDINVQQGVFRDLCIKNCFTYAIRISGVGSADNQQALNNLIDRCYINGEVGVTEFFDAVFLDNHTADTKILGTYVQGAKNSCIRSRAYNDQIEGCHLFASSGSGGGSGYGYYSEFSADKTFVGNYIENTANAAIFVDGGASDVATLNATITGNTLRNINKGATASGAIVFQNTNVSSLSVSGNVVRRDAATSYSTAYFVYFNGITPNAVQIFGNTAASGLITTAETNQTGFNARVLATGSTALRTLQSRFSDIANVKDWGAVGDGTTSDTAAITAADAVAGAKFSPAGTYKTTIAASSLTGPYWGRGQIKDSGNDLRGPWFSAITAAPSALGNLNSITTAFDGDLSKVQIAMEHRVTGAATAGQPATGYLVTPEVSPVYLYEFNTAGNNQSTSTNDGRTGQSMISLNFNHGGQGDLGGIWVNGVISSTRASASSFLACPGAQIIYGQLFAGAIGAYLNPVEFGLNDNGVQSAAIGFVPNFTRTVATSTLGEVWMGIRPQTAGSTPCDVIYSGAGTWKVGLDFTGVTFDANKTALALKADDRIYGNATASGTVPWAQTLGTPFLTWSSTLTTWISNDGLKSTSATKGLGYGTGAGGTVTQATSKSTAVTLNTLSGQITMNNAALLTITTVVFQVNNTAYNAATDTVIAHHASGGTAGVYTVLVASSGTNAFNLRVTNNTGGTLSEAIVINFNVIKGASA